MLLFIAQSFESLLKPSESQNCRALESQRLDMASTQTNHDAGDVLYSGLHNLLFSSRLLQLQMDIIS